MSEDLEKNNAKYKKFSRLLYSVCLFIRFQIYAVCMCVFRNLRKLPDLPQVPGHVAVDIPDAAAQAGDP